MRDGLGMMADIESVQLPTDAVEVGTVVDAWGVQGWLKVLPHSLDPQALFSSKRWYFQPRVGNVPVDALLASAPAPHSARLFRVREARQHAKVVVAQIDGIESRDEALALRGGQLFVPRSSFPTPQVDEYYWVDLIGLKVVNREGMDLGQVVALHPTGPHSALVLQSPESSEKKSQRMIPFVSAYVDSVNLQERRIVVDWQADY